MNTATAKYYPFKFLDSYTREDYKFFFGRRNEIDKLYRMVFESDLLVVYGASGTGKTSLIQCGLAGKFNSHDWMPLMVRRVTNINDSLMRVLAEAGGALPAEDVEDDLTAFLSQDFSDPNSGTYAATIQSPVAKSLRQIYRNNFKPIYLIFDQFEELYILGDKKEQMDFIKQVKDILQVEQPVKVIISIREEYLGHLYEFERQVPELLRKKLRVEAMDLDKVEDVVIGVGEHEESLITLKKGEEKEIARAIFEKVKGQRETRTIELPYLQVYLDKLYIRVSGDKERTTEAEFTLEAIQKMGDIEDVLRNFLEEQTRELARKRNLRLNMVWEVLSKFVTVEGTKEPLSEDELVEELPHLDQQEVLTVLNDFSGGYIIRKRSDENLYELKHDSLAKIIHQRRDEESLALLEVQRLIKSRMAMSAQQRNYLSSKDLRFLAPFRKRLESELNKEERAYLRNSRVRAQTWWLLTRIIVLGTLVIMTIMAFYLYDQLQRVKITEQELRSSIDRQDKLNVLRKVEELVTYGDSYNDLGENGKAQETWTRALDSLMVKDSLKQDPMFQGVYHELEDKLEDGNENDQ